MLHLVRRRQCLQEWRYKTVPLLLTDSQSAFAVFQRRGPGRNKHIKLKMFTVHEWMKTGRFRIHKASTHDNLADLMTKAMNREKLTKFGRVLNLRGSFFTDLGQPDSFEHFVGFPSFCLRASLFCAQFRRSKRGVHHLLKEFLKSKEFNAFISFLAWG